MRILKSRHRLPSPNPKVKRNRRRKMPNGHAVSAPISLRVNCSISKWRSPTTCIRMWTFARRSLLRLNWPKPRWKCGSKTDGPSIARYSRCSSLWLFIFDWFLLEAKGQPWIFITLAFTPFNVNAANSHISPASILLLNGQRITLNLGNDKRNSVVRERLRFATRQLLFSSLVDRLAAPILNSVLCDTSIRKHRGTVLCSCFFSLSLLVCM